MQSSKGMHLSQFSDDVPNLMEAVLLACSTWAGLLHLLDVLSHTLMQFLFAHEAMSDDFAGCGAPVHARNLERDGGMPLEPATQGNGMLANVSLLYIWQHLEKAIAFCHRLSAELVAWVHCCADLHLKTLTSVFQASMRACQDVAAA